MEELSPKTRKMTLNAVPIDLIEEIDKFVNWRKKRGMNTSRERTIIDALNQVFIPKPSVDITDYGETLER